MEILARVHSSSKQPLVNPAALGGLLLERRSVYAFDPRWTKSLRHLGIEWWIDAGLTRTKEGNAFSFKLAPGEPSELFDSPSTLPYDALRLSRRIASWQEQGRKQGLSPSHRIPAGTQESNPKMFHVGPRCSGGTSESTSLCKQPTTSSRIRFTPKKRFARS